MTQAAELTAWLGIDLDRAWLTDQVRRHLAGHAQHLLITGRRRSGKSTLLKRLHGMPGLLPGARHTLLHVCDRETDGSANPVADFLMSIEVDLDRQDPQPATSGADPRLEGPGPSHRWRKYLLPRLRALAARLDPDQHLYICVDGLDQDHTRTGQRLVAFLRDDLDDLPPQIRLVMTCQDVDTEAIGALTSALPVSVLELTSDTFDGEWRDDLLAYAAEAQARGLPVRPPERLSGMEVVSKDFTCLRDVLIDGTAREAPVGRFDPRLREDVQACLHRVGDGEQRELARRLLVVAAVLTGPVPRDVVREMLRTDERRFAEALRAVSPFVRVHAGTISMHSDHYAVEILHDRLDDGREASAHGHAIVANHLAAVGRRGGRGVTDPYLFSKGLYHAVAADLTGGDYDARLTRIVRIVGDRLVHPLDDHPRALVEAATESYVRALLTRATWTSSAPRRLIRLLGSPSGVVQDRLAVIGPDLIAACGPGLRHRVLRALARSGLPSAANLCSRTLPLITDREAQAAELWWVGTRGRGARRADLGARIGHDWVRTDEVGTRVGSALLRAATARRPRSWRPAAMLTFGRFAADVTIGSWISDPRSTVEIEASSVFWETILIDRLHLPGWPPVLARGLARLFAGQIGATLGRTVTTAGLAVGPVPAQERALTTALLDQAADGVLDARSIAVAMSAAGDWSSLVLGCAAASTAFRDADEYVAAFAEVVQAPLSPTAVALMLQSVLAVPVEQQVAVLPSVERLLDAHWATSHPLGRSDGLTPVVAAVGASHDAGALLPGLVAALSGARGPIARDEAVDAVAAVVSLRPEALAVLLPGITAGLGRGGAEVIRARCSPALGEQLRDVSRFATAAALAVFEYPGLRDALFIPAVDRAVRLRSARRWSRTMPVTFVRAVADRGYRIGLLFGYDGRTP